VVAVVTPDRLRQMADAATPGPWQYRAYLGYYVEPRDGGAPPLPVWGDEDYDADSVLIAALGPDAARLLADAMDALDSGGTCPDPDCTLCALLARFAALEDATG
jgi:hypothetical protein